MKLTGLIGTVSLMLTLLSGCQTAVEDLSYDLTGIARSIERCDKLGDYHDGLAYVLKDGKLGFMDRKGNMTVSYDFHVISVEDIGYGMIKARISGNESVYIDWSGKELFRSSLDITAFSEGLGRVVSSDESCLVGFVDKKGNLVIPCKYAMAGNFKDDRCWVTLPDDPLKVGFINSKGELVIPCEYNVSREGRLHSDFHDGLCRVVKDNEQYIDLSGNQVFAVGNDIISCGDFSEGLASVLCRKEDGTFAGAYIDKTGHRVITLPDGIGEDFHEGIAPVTSEQGVVFINKEGAVVGGLPAGASVVRYSGERTWQIMSKDYKIGYLSCDMEQVVPCKYDDGGDFFEGLVRVQNEGGQWGYADLEGNVTFGSVSEVAATEEVVPTETTVPDADGIYEARIVDGEVYVDFDHELTKRFVSKYFGENAYEPVGKNLKVEGLKGSCLEVMKCIVGKGGASYDGVGRPYLVMRTDEEKVYLLSIIEALEGDMLCGPVPNTDGAVALTTGYEGNNGLYASAKLKDGTEWTFDGWWLWGYYVMEDYGFVVHLSRDYCVCLDKQPPHEYHNCGTFYQSWAGSGIMVLSTDLEVGSLSISMKEYDEDSEGTEEIWSLEVNDVVDNPSIPILCEQSIRSVRLSVDPWKSGYFKDHS